MTSVKTAVSLPADLFDHLVAEASERGMTRSGLIADALARYFRERRVESLRRAFETAYSRESDEGLEEERQMLDRAARASVRMLAESDPWLQ